MRGVTRTGIECFQLPTFPCNGIDPMTRDVLAISDVEPFQVVACISNGNECIVSDVFAEQETNLCDSGRVDIIIIEKINNVFIPQLLIIVSKQSTGEVQDCSILSDDILFDKGSNTKCVSHRCSVVLQTVVVSFLLSGMIGSTSLKFEEVRCVWSLLLNYCFMAV